MFKKSHKVWYVKIRGSYLPYSWQGWLLYVPFVLFLLATMVLALRGGRTNAGVVYFLFPQYISALVVMHWVASRFSK